jgi:hypothetical protein
MVLNMDEKQQKLYKIINKIFQGVSTLKTGKIVSDKLSDEFFKNNLFM